MIRLLLISRKDIIVIMIYIMYHPISIPIGSYLYHNDTYNLFKGGINMLMSSMVISSFCILSVTSTISAGQIGVLGAKISLRY